MWERLTALLRRLDLLPEETSEKEKRGGDGPVPPEIEFRSLDPSQAAALGTEKALVCPVTRKTLRQGSSYYLCSDCNTAYSAEGWDFLRETDKGRCCNCRHTGSVGPVRNEGPFA